MPDAPAVAIVSELAGRMLFRGENPLGRKILLGVTQRTAEIVGVVADVRGDAVATGAKPTVYFPADQRPRLITHVLVRVAGRTPAQRQSEVEALAPTVRALVGEIDREIPVITPRPMTDLVRRSVADARLTTGLIGTFAVTALLLAGLGIHGVVRHTVARRTGEIGLRMRAVPWAGMEAHRWRSRRARRRRGHATSHVFNTLRSAHFPDFGNGAFRKCHAVVVGGRRREFLRLPIQSLRESFQRRHRRC